MIRRPRVWEGSPHSNEIDSKWPRNRRIQARGTLLPYMEELCATQRHEDEVLCAFAEVQ